MQLGTGDSVFSELQGSLRCPSASAPAQSPQVQDTQGLWDQRVQVLGHLDESCLQGHLQELALWLESLRTGHNLMI